MFSAWSEKKQFVAVWLILQVQFMIVLGHTLLILQPSCTYPKITFVFLAPNSVIFFYLFNDFYQQAYRKSAAAAAKTNGVHKNGVHKNGTSSMVISACYSPDSKLDWECCVSIVILVFVYLRCLLTILDVLLHSIYQKLLAWARQNFLLNESHLTKSVAPSVYQPS